MSFAAGIQEDYDPSSLLNFWNICSDLAFTLEVPFLGDDDNDALSEIYDTLFFMSSSEPDAEPTKETRTDDDISDLKEVISDGCKLIVSNLNAI